MYSFTISTGSTQYPPRGIRVSHCDTWDALVEEVIYYLDSVLNVREAQYRPLQDALNAKDSNNIVKHMNALLASPWSIYSERGGYVTEKGPDNA